MKERQECEIDACASSVLAKGLCAVHYDRKRRTGSVELQPKISDSMCLECGRRRAALAPGLCRTCYQRQRRDAQYAQGLCQFCGEPFTSERRYTDTSNRGRFCSRECKTKERTASGKANEAVRKHYYQSRYGLTVEEADRLRVKGCGICGTTVDRGRWATLHIDHDHNTGRVRGILCGACNLGLGKFRDDPVLLRKAADYLSPVAASS